MKPDADRQKRIRARAETMVADLRRLAEQDPARLEAVDFMVLALNTIVCRVAAGEVVTVDPPVASILRDGVVAMLCEAASASLDAEDARAAVLERELAGRTPVILH